MKQMIAAFTILAATPALAEDRVFVFDQGEVACIAANIFHEARGESYEGQLAVFNVTMNRIFDRRWPDTACEVVMQPYQFSWTMGDLKAAAKQRFVTENDTFVRLVKQVEAWIDSYPMIMNQSADHYARVEISNYWTEAYTKVNTIGDHAFYSSGFSNK